MEQLLEDPIVRLFLELVKEQGLIGAIIIGYVYFKWIHPRIRRNNESGAVAILNPPSDPVEPHAPDKCPLGLDEDVRRHNGMLNTVNEDIKKILNAVGRIEGAICTRKK